MKPVFRPLLETRKTGAMGSLPVALASMVPSVLALMLSLVLAAPANAQSQTATPAQNVCATQASAINPWAAASPGLGGSGAPLAELSNAFKGLWQNAKSLLGTRPQAGSAAGDGSLAQGGNSGIGGVGGTGAVAGRPGLGGTGISEGGIGGTGIVGVITGFASICVNGVEIMFDANTPVLDNGQPASARQLAVGQVVAVRAASAGAATSARSIAMIHAAVGPLGAVNPTTGEFTILGQTGRVLYPDDLSGLKAQDWVRISGHRRAQGDIVASSIEPVAAQAQVQLIGLVSELSAEGLRVMGTRVRMGSQLLPAGLTLGQEVSVSGVWDGTFIEAQRVQLDPTRSGFGAVEQVVLEGYIHALDGRELSLGLERLTLGPGVQVVSSNAAPLAVNQRVQVRGRVGADQRITVDRVEVNGGASDTGRSDVGRGVRSEGQRGSGRGMSGGRGSSGRSGSSGSSRDSRSSERSESSGRSGSSENSGRSGDLGRSDDSGGSGNSGGSGGSESSGSSGGGDSGGSGSSGGGGDSGGSGGSGGGGDSGGGGSGGGGDSGGGGSK